MTRDGAAASAAVAGLALAGLALLAMLDVQPPSPRSADADTVICAMDDRDGLSDLPGLDSRPADVGIAGSHTAELVVVARGYPLP